MPRRIRTRVGQFDSALLRYWQAPRALSQDFHVHNADHAGYAGLRMARWKCPICHADIRCESEEGSARPERYTIYACPECRVHLVWNSDALSFQPVRAGGSVM